MAQEYYFSKIISLEYIKKELPSLSVKFYKKDGVAIIKDKYGNYVQAWGMNNTKDAIKFFNGKEDGGAPFVIHDIAIKTNALFITGDSYLMLCDEMEKVGQIKMQFGDKLSLPYIIMDMQEVSIKVVVKNNKYRLKKMMEDEAFEKERSDFQQWRELKKQEEIAKDNEALFRQIAKINKTNISMSNVIANIDIELTETNTPNYNN